MTSLSQTFAVCARRKRKALMPYLTAGYPDRRTFLRLLARFEQSGADIIEVGVPFSDPLADGPTIQYSSQQALNAGITISEIFTLLKQANHDRAVPRVLMSYYNPVRAYGQEKFARDAREAGVSGLIVPDLPVEEGEATSEACRKEGIDLIYLLAPTTPEDRRRKIINRSRGFVYLVSVTGVTGARKTLPRRLQNLIRDVKNISRLPVCVGFGIAGPDQAHAVARDADGVIIGSAIIEIINQAGNTRQAVENTGRFLRRVREVI